MTFRESEPVKLVPLIDQEIIILFKAGDEVIQVYVRDKVCSHAKPVMELKAFRRVHFDAGETQEVELRISRAELEVYQGCGEWKFEPGEFVIMAGGSSDKLPLQETIRLK